MAAADIAGTLQFPNCLADGGDRAGGAFSEVRKAQDALAKAVTVAVQGSPHAAHAVRERVVAQETVGIPKELTFCFHVLIFLPLLCVQPLAHAARSFCASQNKAREPGITDKLIASALSVFQCSARYQSHAAYCPLPIGSGAAASMYSCDPKNTSSPERKSACVMAFAG